MCSDWLTVEHYSPVMPMGQLRACKAIAKRHMINNLLTMNVWSLWKNPKRQPYLIGVTITSSIQHGLGLRFSHKDLTLGL